MYYATLEDLMEMTQRDYTLGDIGANEILEKLTYYIATYRWSLGDKFNADAFIAPLTTERIRFGTLAQQEICR